MLTSFIEANVEEFLTRFYHCYDGMIQNIYLDLSGGAFNYDVTVVIFVRDSTLPDEHSLVELRVVFDKVNEYVIRHGHGGFIQVLSGGVSVFFESNLLHFDFTWDETKTIEDIRRSDFYFQAKSASWEVVRQVDV